MNDTVNSVAVQLCWWPSTGCNN